MSVASGDSHKAPSKAKSFILPVLMSLSERRGQPLPLGASSWGGSNHAARLRPTARGLPWGAEPETLCLFRCWLLEDRTKGVLQGCTAAKQLQRHCPFITSPFFISWISSQYLCLTLTFFCGKHFLFSAVFLIFLSFPSGRFCGKIEAPSRTCCFDRREITLFSFLVGASLSKLVRFFHSQTFLPSWKRSWAVILLPHGKWEFWYWILKL